MARPKSSDEASSKSSRRITSADDDMMGISEDLQVNGLKKDSPKDNVKDDEQIMIIHIPPMMISKMGKKTLSPKQKHGLFHRMPDLKRCQIVSNTRNVNVSNDSTHRLSFEHLISTSSSLLNLILPSSAKI